MKTKAVFLCIIFLCISHYSHSDIPECCCLPQYYTRSNDDITNPGDTNIYFNRDSSQVFDTCGMYIYYRNTMPNCGNILREFLMKVEYFDRMRAKGRYKIEFDVNAIPIPAAPIHTIIERKWEDIDESYPSIRTGFKNIEQKYGSFIFRKVNPHYGEGYFSRVFYLIFDNYVNWYGTEKEVSDIENTKCYFLDHLIILSSIEDENKSTVSLKIIPNPSENKIRIIIQDKDIIDGSLRIINIVGEIIIRKDVYNEEEIEFDISSLPNGIYFVNFNGLTKQFIINR